MAGGRSHDAPPAGPRAREIRARVGVCEKRLENILEQADKTVALELGHGLADRVYVDKPLEPVITVASFVPSEST